MIFSISRLVNGAKQNLSWSLKIGKNPKIKAEAAKRGGLAKYFVDERAEIVESNCVLAYLAHLMFFGILFWLAVGYPCWIIATTFVILIVSTVISLRASEDTRRKTDKSVQMTLDYQW